MTASLAKPQNEFRTRFGSLLLLYDSFIEGYSLNDTILVSSNAPDALTATSLALGLGNQEIPT